MTEGEGMAGSCEGYIYAGGDINNLHSVWADNSKDCNIFLGTYMDLRLFRIEYVQQDIGCLHTKPLIPKLIHFPTLTAEPIYKEIGIRSEEVERPYDKYANEILTVRIGLKNGKIPQPWTMKIDDIINKKIC